MIPHNEFRKYATKHRNINSNVFDSYVSAFNNEYISPTIIEERQMNIATMDVFSRLMMDRIIFLGVGINDYVANGLAEAVGGRGVELAGATLRAVAIRKFSTA